jgi:DNA-binding SARP family transcriptional activator
MPQSRQQVAFLFWPDTSEAQARNNLRQTLHQLRGELPNADRFLDVGPGTLRWRLDSPFSLDVADFEEEVSKADTAERTANQAALQTALEQATTLYQGDLMPSCYDEWILPERERLHEKYLRVLERLVRLLEEQRDYGAAIQYAQQLLRHDPLLESTYLYLMRLHTLSHNRAAALRTYHACTTALERELGVQPGPAIRAAYERLVQMNAQPDWIPEHRSALTALPDLIGRQSEWKQLQTVWQRAASGHLHLVVLSGDAGIGKSRLAEELLEWADQQGIATARTRAYAAEGRLSYAPLTDWLRSSALRSGLSRLDKVWVSEVARVLPELLVEWPTMPPPVPLTEYWQRQR